MTIDSYRNFVAIVDNGNILAASQKLMIAQPALSNQLKNIELNYGAKLINRGSRKLELTDAGKIFYQKAKIICSVEDSVRKEINDCIGGITGTLRLSLPPSNPESLMHNLFDKFVALHPQVNYEVYEVFSEDVAENVRNGISEIGLIRSNIRNSQDFNFMPYEEEEIMAVVSPDHPYASQKSITLSQLEDQKITVPAGCLPEIDNAFRTMKTVPRIYVKASTRSAAIYWASNNNCVALVPCGVRDLKEDNDMVNLKISDYNFQTQRAFITLNGHELSQLAKEFIHYQNLN